MSTILERAMAMNDEIVANRRTIHQNPEVGHNLPNTVIGYSFNNHILHLFQKENLGQRGFMPQRGFALVADVHFRLYFEETSTSNNRLLYNGGYYSLFYTTYGESFVWEKDGLLAYCF